MTEELDDLTLIYMYGYKNGKQIMKDEIERLRGALQEIAWIATPDHEEARHKATETARAALAGEATDDAAP